MCGIAGIYAFVPGAPVTQAQEVHAISQAMANRGPDGAGAWIAPHERIGLAHRRLSILDLSESGAQPMSTPEGRLWITFNGEIYNFRELRAGLEARGHRFRSTSDTEVLLHLYLEYGADMVRHLRGMFAFGIWDEREQTLFLARDPFGIKPLYYVDSKGVFRFASQVKALLAGGGVDTAPDPAGHCGFFLWGSVPEPYTTYRAIRALPAGCTMLVTPKGAQAPSRYFSVRDEMLRAQADARPMAAIDAQALVAEALHDSVRHHLVADVPVGVFLSAGIDSSVLTAIASDLAPGRLRTVTLGFREYLGTEMDETPWAERTSAAYGTQHETRWIERKDFGEKLEAILAAMDQPSIDGVNTYFVSRAAAQTGLKVALSGVGGDELFSGYSSFRDVPRLERLPALGRHLPRAARLLRRMTRIATGRRISPKYAGIFELAGSTGGAYLLRRGLYMPWELEQVMDRDMAEGGLAELAALESVEASVGGIRNPRLRVSGLELAWYMRNQLLRDADWAGMAHSLEIRVPLVDAHFFRAILPALASPRPPGKATLAAAPRRPLPREIVQRAKSGFAVPVAEWVRSGARGLRGWARRVNVAPGVGYRILVPLTDAHGGIGGIARFNRNLLAAISSHNAIREIVVLPRLAPLPWEEPPHKVLYARDALRGKGAYILTLLSRLFAGPQFDLVVCGHLNLVFLSFVAARIHSAPSLGILHGIEAWTPPRHVLNRLLVKRIGRYAAVSAVTRDRFLAWSRVSSRHMEYLPNTVDLQEFSPGPKEPALEARYGIRGRRVLLTVGRLVAAERYKGFDAVIEVLPRLLEKNPDLAYLIVGDGTDRQRLQERVRSEGLDDCVRFAGYISEREKAGHYRLADVYVMPSKGEGFGIVLLEALASGIPVVASKVDGSREAVLDGQMGILVNPDVPEEIVRAVEQALNISERRVPPQLEHYSFPKFELRCHQILANALHSSDPGFR